MTMKQLEKNRIRLFPIVSAVLAIGIYSSVSAADTPTRCARYAKSAVAQNLENNTKGCALSGPEWSSNYDYHYNWCMHGDNSTWPILNRGWNGRRDALSKCKPVSQEFSCEAYATLAVRANDKNIYWGCGFAGPKWSSDYRHHLDWCKHGDNFKNFAAKENVARQNAIKDCPAPE